MGYVSVDRLREFATRFREAIERCPKDRLPFSIQAFPRGACGDASILLGKYLADEGFGVFDYVSGQYSDRTHAWIEQGEVIIDITADQFPEITEAIIVTKDKRWHSQFVEKDRHSADPDLLYGEETASTLKAALVLVKNFLR